MTPPESLRAFPSLYPLCGRGRERGATPSAWGGAAGPGPSSVSLSWTVLN